MRNLFLLLWFDDARHSINPAEADWGVAMWAREVIGIGSVGDRCSLMASMQSDKMRRRADL